MLGLAANGQLEYNNGGLPGTFLSDRNEVGAGSQP